MESAELVSEDRMVMDLDDLKAQENSSIIII